MIVVKPSYFEKNESYEKDNILNTIHLHHHVLRML